MYEKFAELLVKNNKTAYAVSKETGIPQSVLSDWKEDEAILRLISCISLRITSG